MKNDFKEVLKGLNANLKDLFNFQTCKGYKASSDSPMSKYECSKPILTFAVYLYYSGIIDEEQPVTKKEVEEILNKRKQNLCQAWDVLANHEIQVSWFRSEFDQKDLNPIFSMVQGYNLGQYRSIENDKILIEWSCKYNAMPQFFVDNENKIKLLKVLSQVKSNLGINDKGDFIISHISENSDKIDYLALLFKGNLIGGHYTIILSEYNWLASVIVDCLETMRDNKIIYSKDFTLEKTALYDGVICMNDDKVEYKSILSHIKENGWLLAPGNENNKLIDDDIFENYDIQIMFYFDKEEKQFYLIRNNHHDDDSIKYVNFIDQNKEDDIVRRITNNDMDTHCFQILDKQDFRLHKDNISFFKVSRKIEEIGFKHYDVNDLIKIQPYRRVMADVPRQKIVESLDFSQNSFNFNLPANYYLEAPVNKIDHDFSEEGIEDVLDEYQFQKELGIYDNSIIYDFESGERTDDETRIYYDFITLSILEHPAIIAMGNKFVRVNASIDHPVFYRAHAFDIEQFNVPVPLWGPCEVKLNPDFDEECLLMQLRTMDFIVLQSELKKGSKYILLPTTKEEQRSYYEKKKQEYLMANADLMNEVRKDERNDIKTGHTLKTPWHKQHKIS